LGTNSGKLNAGLLEVVLAGSEPRAASVFGSAYASTRARATLEGRCWPPLLLAGIVALALGSWTTARRAAFGFRGTCMLVAALLWVRQSRAPPLT
jgi:hypothetical protein